MDISHVFEPVPNRDWLVTVLLFGGITLVIAVSEWIRSRLNWPAEFTRKLVHILVGLLAFFLPLLLTTSLPIVILAIFFTLSNLIAIKLDLLKGMHGVRESYGTVYYPLALLVLTLFAWPDQKLIIITAMLILGLGDALAAIVGESISKPHQYQLVGDAKSFEGSATMLFVSMLVTFGVLSYYTSQLHQLEHPGMLVLVWTVIVTAIFATAAESLSYKGSDNLSVPLAAALMLYPMLNFDNEARQLLTLGLILAAIAGISSYRLRFLSASGAIATFLLATIVFGFGGWKWTIPILAFFLLSSLLSKFGKPRKAYLDLVFEKGSQRDHGQVAANGGIAGVLMIVHMFLGSEILYPMYLGSLAAATADTWATELGTLGKSRPRLVTTWKPVAAGTSGGISLRGTLSGMAGAACIGLCGSLFVSPDLRWSIIAAAVVSGFVGSLADSFLGATIQAQYRCPTCNKRTEKLRHCADQPTELISGFPWLQNDVVNLLATAVGALTGAIFFLNYLKYPI